MNHLEHEYLYLGLRLAQNDHRAELLREAARERLVRLARHDSRRLHYTILAWTGRRLVRLGRTLLVAAEQARPEAPVVQIESGYRNW